MRKIGWGAIIVGIMTIAGNESLYNAYYRPLEKEQKIERVETNRTNPNGTIEIVIEQTPAEKTKNIVNIIGFGVLGLGSLIAYAARKNHQEEYYKKYY